MTVKQIKSMKAMQELQPRMKELQEKYKNDPQRLQAEMGCYVQRNGRKPIGWLLAFIGANAVLDCYFLRIARISLQS